MQFIPVKTRILIPPKDDFCSVLDTVCEQFHEGDIILITSKVVSIHEGRCIPIEGTDKDLLVKNETDLWYQAPGRKKPFTLVHNALISSAGIDESNGSGYYTLLPKNGFESARFFCNYIKEKTGYTNIGIIITDSHSTPLRYGATSVSIGCWGFLPVESHIGKKDLFDRTIEYAKTNIVDAIAAGATGVSGECAEATPIVIARNVPKITWTSEDPRSELIVPYEQDHFRALFEKFSKPDQG
jgi:dihydrofolate synthase / folylpolyglutamate synthase